MKTVKLSENPSINELIKQLVILNEKFTYIVSSFKNLNIKLERKQMNSGVNDGKRSEGQQKKGVRIMKGVHGMILPN